MSHIRFLEIEKKPKTSVYAITSNHDNSNLGVVQWYPQWRQYCFLPDANCVWSIECLNELSLFLIKLKLEREEKTKRGKENES